MPRIILAATFCAVLALVPAPHALAQLVGQWERLELSFENNTGYPDPVRDVTLTATLTRPDGSTVEREGFFDGGTTWRLRLMPDAPGGWYWTASFSDSTPAGSGEFDCVASGLAGPLRPDPWGGTGFAHADGQPFRVRGFHVGDRYFAANWSVGERLAFLDWFEGHRYNLLSVASHYLNRNEPGRGEGWDTPDLWPIDPAEYRQMEARLDELTARGIVVYPFAGFLGVSADRPTDPADVQLYLRYTIARMQGYWNVLYNVAGPEPVANYEFSEGEANDLGELVQQHNAAGHLLSIHARRGDFPYGGEAWCDYVTLQGPKTTDPVELHDDLLRNRVPGKPLLAQEVLWTGNQNHPAYSDAQFRRNAWVLAMSQASLVFADNDGNSSSGFSGTLDLALRDQPRHDIVATVWDFMDTLPDGPLLPAPGVASTGYAMADPGRRYLVYLPGGGPVDLQLEGGPFSPGWYDAADPTRHFDAGQTSEGQGLLPPAGAIAPEGWVLLLRRVALSPRQSSVGNFKQDGIEP